MEELPLALDEVRTAHAELRQQKEHVRLSAQATEGQQSIEDLVLVLEQERQTLQTIMENTPAQLAYLDPEFNFVRVNTCPGRKPSSAKRTANQDQIAHPGY